MGNSKSKNNGKGKQVAIAKNPEPKKIIPVAPDVNYKLIHDKFTNYADLENALRTCGLESCELIVGIDFTKSNTYQGGTDNGYRYSEFPNLHQISMTPNPYQQVLSIMCQSLAMFDDDQLIDAFGFGDIFTTDKSVFSFNMYSDTNGNMIEGQCRRLDGVLQRYQQLVPSIEMSGPTSFAPIINKAIEIVKGRNRYHILLIIADGAVNNVKETTDAIIAASKYPLSIICIGVGKGPWHLMEKMDDDIPERDFDNFQFVDFHKIMDKCENEAVEFARNALMEIPVQYDYIKKNILK